MINKKVRNVAPALEGVEDGMSLDARWIWTLWNSRK